MPRSCTCHKLATGVVASRLNTGPLVGCHVGRSLESGGRGALNGSPSQSFDRSPAASSARFQLPNAVERLTGLDVPASLPGCGIGDLGRLEGASYACGPSRSANSPCSIWFSTSVVRTQAGNSAAVEIPTSVRRGGAHRSSLGANDGTRIGRRSHAPNRRGQEDSRPLTEQMTRLSERLELAA